MKCIICQNDIEIESSGWADGNNALPVKEGRCCNKCDKTVVIAARMKHSGYSEDEIQKYVYAKSS